MRRTPTRAPGWLEPAGGSAFALCSAARLPCEQGDANLPIRLSVEIATSSPGAGISGRHQFKSVFWSVMNKALRLVLACLLCIGVIVGLVLLAQWLF
jgi:hypothetical protein